MYTLQCIHCTKVAKLNPKLQNVLIIFMHKWLNEDDLEKKKHTLTIRSASLSIFQYQANWSKDSYTNVFLRINVRSMKTSFDNCSKKYISYFPEIKQISI